MTFEQVYDTGSKAEVDLFYRLFIPKLRCQNESVYYVIQGIVKLMGRSHQHIKECFLIFVLSTHPVFIFYVFRSVPLTLSLKKNHCELVKQYVDVFVKCIVSSFQHKPAICRPNHYLFPHCCYDCSVSCPCGADCNANCGRNHTSQSKYISCWPLITQQLNSVRRQKKNERKEKEMSAYGLLKAGI